MTYLLVCVFALSIMILLMPLLQRLALHIGAVDQPGARKVHTVPIPRIGGVLITFSILLSLVVFAPLAKELRALMAGMLTISALGLTDDILGVKAVAKFGVQWLVAILFLAMIRPDLEAVLGLPNALLLAMAAFFLVALVNAINLQDGLDGLAAGQVVISAVCMGIHLLYSGEWILVLVLTATVSAVMGFLRVNTWPASIFMGDAGSYVLGFILGAVFLLGLSAGALPWWSALCYFALPLFDTAQVIVGRLLAGRPIFHADRSHVHHRLMATALEHRQVVHLEYMLVTFAAILPLFIKTHRYPQWTAILLIVSMGAVFLWRHFGWKREILPREEPSWFRSGLKWTLIVVLSAIYILQLWLFHGRLHQSSGEYTAVARYVVLPVTLSFFYAIWSSYRLRHEHSARISTSLTLLMGTELFVFHQFGAQTGFYENGVLIHLGLWALLAGITLLLVIAGGKDKDILATDSPLDYLLVFLAIALLFMPSNLNLLFQTNRVALELLAYFFVLRVATRIFHLETHRLVLPVFSVLFILLLLVGWL